MRPGGRPRSLPFSPGRRAAGGLPPLLLTSARVATSPAPGKEARSMPSLGDYWIIYFMVKGPVALGVAILLAAIEPAGTLGRELPSRSMRVRWRFLRLLIGFLIAGYIAFSGLD